MRRVSRVPMVNTSTSRRADTATCEPMQVVRLDTGLLFYFAIASLANYGATLAGWASYNKWSLLGGLRAASQSISYEVTMGMALVGIFLVYDSLEPGAIVRAQGANILDWGIVRQPIGFVLFTIAAIAETKRAPFDLPEGESEIVGYFVEYSGMQWGLMFLAEFVEIVILSGVIVAVFLGGWHPIVVNTEWLRQHVTPLWFGAICAASFLVKMIVTMWLQLTIRWLLPRFRFDQIQKLCWKILLPTALANVFVTAAAMLIDPSKTLLAWIGVATIVAIVVITTAVGRAPSQEQHEAAHAAAGH